MQNYLIDEQRTIEVNGDRQNIRIRAAERGLPVILFLHGGPGVCDRHLVLSNQSDLARYYTMVCWDQRGSGKSYNRSIKKQQLSVETYVDDAEAVIDYLRDSFGVEKVIIAGHSWGTVIGTKLALRCPQKISAYIAQGMFIDGAENELQSYNFCLARARELGDKKAVSRLEPICPKDGRYPSDKAMMTQRDYLSKYGGGTYKKREGMIRSLLVPLLKTKEYRLRDIPAYAKGGLYLSKTLWNDIVSVSFLSVTSLKVPLIVTQGDHDYNTPTAIAGEWFGSLSAPYKAWISFDSSAHSPIFEEPEKWGREVLAALGAIGAQKEGQT